MPADLRLHALRVMMTLQVCVEPNAVHVATVDAVTGQPSVRVVLLKGFDERGFIFYTNYSRWVWLVGEYWLRAMRTLCG
jgi:hypothetical protein